MDAAGRLSFIPPLPPSLPPLPPSLQLYLEPFFSSKWMLLAASPSLKEGKLVAAVSASCLFSWWLRKGEEVRREGGREECVEGLLAASPSRKEGKLLAASLFLGALSWWLRKGKEVRREGGREGCVEGLLAVSPSLKEGRLAAAVIISCLF